MPGKFDINPSTGKQYGINPSTGVQDDNYWGNVVEPSLKSQYPQQKSAVDQAEELRQFQIKANQPVVQSLQSSIPTTQSSYDQRGQTLGAEKTNLEDRYQSVLQDLTARENKETSSAQIASAQEFGKRGIPLSSGAFSQYQSAQVNPITESYGATRANTGANFADLSAQLADQIGSNPIEKQKAVDAINQAIAQLQSGDPAAAIQGALQLQQLQQQAQQSSTDSALRSKAENFSETQATNSGASGVALSPNSIYIDPTTGKIIASNRSQVQSNLGGWDFAQ